jgi:hypothetical protein
MLKSLKTFKIFIPKKAFSNNINNNKNFQKSEFLTEMRFKEFYENLMKDFDTLLQKGVISENSKLFQTISTEGINKTKEDIESLSKIIQEKNKQEVCIK